MTKNSRISNAFVASVWISFLAVSACQADSQPDSSSSIAERDTLVRGTRPNILYITADDLAPTIGAYGDPQAVTPHIDALAGEGLLFEEVHVQVASCTPSRTSILTGVRPSTSGITQLNHDWKEVLPEVTSLPEHLQVHGYETVSIGKIWDPRSGSGSDLGWDYKPHEHQWGISDSEEVVRHLRRLAGSERPWALFVGTRAPHCPWAPSEASRRLYDVDAIEAYGPGREFSQYLQECSGANKERIDEAEARDMTMRYLASVTDVDRILGEVVAETKRLGLWNQTIVVFWSGDNGYQLGKQGRWGKSTNYRAATWVPLILQVPGQTTAGTRSPALVEAVDMYPTLVDLAGLPPPGHELEGLSFRPLLSDPTRPWKTAVFTTWGSTANSIKTARYNLIVNTDGSVELYDWSTDPNETRNLAQEMPDVVKRLRERLEAGWRAAMPRAQPGQPGRISGGQ